MADSFEEYTKPLTDNEMLIVPMVVKAFRQYTDDNPIKSAEVVSRFNDWRDAIIAKGGNVVKLNSPLLRKIVHYIRTEKMLLLVADSRGYFVSNDKDKINKCVTSLRQRTCSISEVADSLAEMLQNL